jgi:hypothetical protein
MASITLTVEIDELVNSELDGVEAKLRKVITDNATKLPGSITDVSETDRQEDDEDDTD